MRRNMLCFGGKRALGGCVGFSPAFLPCGFFLSDHDLCTMHDTRIPVSVQLTYYFTADLFSQTSLFLGTLVISFPKVL